MLMGNRPARRRHARPARHALARPDHGQERLSAAVPDRRDGRRRRRHLVDRQHPHDLFMELSDFLQRAARPARAPAFAYFGLPGEPALGPPAFMHRFSGMRNPGGAAARHHWLDSTHITFGVATLGVEPGAVPARRLLVQRPRARSVPLEHRDAQVRLLVDAALVQPDCPSCPMQVSYGDLKSPEQLEPDVRPSARRPRSPTTRRLGADEWATTPRLRREPTSPGPTTSDVRAGLAARVDLRRSRDTHTFFGRAEQVEQQRAVRARRPAARRRHSGSASSRSATSTTSPGPGPVKWGIGGLVGLLDAPSALDPFYGSSRARTWCSCRAALSHDRVPCSNRRLRGGTQ